MIMHIPTEISAQIYMLKIIIITKIYVIFQPHTYSRTKAFLNEFATSLKAVQNVIITDIYAAREKNPGDIHYQKILYQL
ncbi:hypothetical protein AN396_09125 [Candidatus Epulonipiscium fishelsonii]|uniref:Uncharacterized protein n=1 Tax=Candidatus Epulonipiscium fishelsonii TaxID=77094 RepID=A0ACC8XAA1_9FIRM|nr:hypothetical protein AN396_09125 [Epulopiscium sp. SCG-B11WGA-EpuloA1]